MAIWRGFSRWIRRLRPRLADQPGTDASGALRRAELEPGDTVGEYVIVRKLGEGGFGAVYEATHPVIGKRAAVKVLHPQYTSNEDVAARFVDEARAVNQIRHRNIVDIFSFGDLDDGRHYYVMELLEGAPLDAYLEIAGRLPLEEALAILQMIAKAIGAAHEAGIAHRDLKPENVFLEVDEDGTVHGKILDFGVAKLLAPGGLAAHKTRSGTPIGSPRYMSPEQCRGVQVDHRTDVYAFGCMAHRILTGVAPFDGRTALELMMTHVSVPPPAMSSVCPGLEALDGPVLKMLEKDPDKRPQTMLAAYESIATAAGLGTAPSTKASSILVDLIRIRKETAKTVFNLAGRPRTRPSSSGRSTSVSGTPFWRQWPILLVACLAIFGFAKMRRRAPPALPTVKSPAVAMAAPERSTVPPALEPVAKESASSPETATATEAAAAAASSSAAGQPLGYDLAPRPHGSTSLPGATPAATIDLTVHSQPAQAEVYLNDRKVGTTPGPFQLPRSESPQTIVLKAPGYASASAVVRPLSNTAVSVTLVPTRPPAAPRQGKNAVSRDLEDPY